MTAHTLKPGDRVTTLGLNRRAGTVVLQNRNRVLVLHDDTNAPNCYRRAQLARIDDEANSDLTHIRTLAARYNIVAA